MKCKQIEVNDVPIETRVEGSSFGEILEVSRPSLLKSNEKR